MMERHAKKVDEGFGKGDFLSLSSADSMHIQKIASNATLGGSGDLNSTLVDGLIFSNFSIRV